MKATGVIIMTGAAGALALIGLTLLPSSPPPESPAQPSKPEARAPSAASNPSGASPRADPDTHEHQGAPPPTPAPLAATQEPEPRSDVPSPQPTATEEPRSASATAQGAADSSVLDRLTISRKARTEEERIRALEWLANNAELQHFDALQDIQINDPSPEVRKAAEAAVSAVLRRHRDLNHPQERVEKDPQGYMRDVRVKP